MDRNIIEDILRIEKYKESKLYLISNNIEYNRYVINTIGKILDKIGV